MLRCRACEARFPERKGTPLFGSHLPQGKAVSVLHHIAEGNGIHKTGRLVGVSRETVARYGRKAGAHAVGLHDDLLAAYLRPSNIDAAKHARAILKLLVGRLRAAWPGVKITVRGDSGFCRWRLMRWCDRNGVGYVRGLAKNAALGRASRDEVEAPSGSSAVRAGRNGSSARSGMRPGPGTGDGG